MIPINDYRQFIIELINYAKNDVSLTESHTIKLAITESQLINLIKDLSGIVIAGNIPGAQINAGNGYVASDGECLLMVLEKMPKDRQGTEAEFERLGTLQDLMVAIIKILLNTDGFDRFCDLANIDFSRPLNVEWEYNSYGGFHGLSITFRLRDKNE